MVVVDCRVNRSRIIAESTRSGSRRVPLSIYPLWERDENSKLYFIRLYLG